VIRLRRWLQQAGLEPERLRLEWISAGEGKKLAEVMTAFSAQLKKLGPSPLKYPAATPSSPKQIP